MRSTRVGNNLSVLALRQLDLQTFDWSALDSFDDRVLFQTRAWLDFLVATQGGEPVVAAVEHDSETVGYFTGLVVRRYRVRILGSPFMGWTTAYMGFNLEPGVDRAAALDALAPFAFGELGCAYVEVRDRQLARGDVDGRGWEIGPDPTFLIDLTPTEEELLARMSPSRRRNVRYAARQGVTVEEADDPDFADEYFEHLQDVFAKQALVPTYGVERVRELIRHLHPTGRLLLLRARDGEGRSIATAIVPAFNGTAYMWGGASLREHQRVKPNEALAWYAMTYWKRRGMSEIDLGGGADYKRSYGVVEVDFPRVRRARSVVIGELRHAARRVYRASWRARGRLRKLGHGSSRRA